MLNNIAALIGGAAPEVGDFESIATANGTGSSGTITFTSIPSTYKHLQLRWIGKGSSTSGGYPTDTTFVINSDSTATNYYIHTLSGNGTSAAAGSANNNTNGIAPAIGSYTGLANMYAAGVLDILDYSNTNKFKTLRHLTGCDTNGADSQRIYLSSMLWKNTNAISSISITTDPTYLTNWTTASSFALYGIK